MSRLKPASLANLLSWIAAAILVLIPFHAFLTVWLESAVGHYILIRLWKEILLLILAAGSLYLLATDIKLRRELLTWRLAQFIGLYCAVSILWGFVAYSLHKVTIKALGYGLAVNLRFLAFFLVVWVLAAKSPLLQRLWPKLLLVPAAVVVGFGLAQRLVLPNDFLKHFGYGPSTIYPYETINHNINYPRVMSTLRGANPLGAYLIVVITALASLAARFKNRRWLWTIYGLASALVLVFSYSRGAWIGLAASLGVLTWISLKNEALRRRLLVAAGVLIVASGVALVGLRHNATFENVVFHTQQNSAIKLSSNEGHASAFRSGVHDVMHQPLGRGVGTAGPASVYNDGRQRIAENYYLQIGQEVGWIGLALFVVINVLVVKQLYGQRRETLAKILLASLVGLVLVNLVSHAWTDDTLAYLWWGLAGIALAPGIMRSESQTK